MKQSPLMSPVRLFAYVMSSSDGEYTRH